METEPGPDDDFTALAAELETETITFVDALNDEIADLVETSDHLDYDYICETSPTTASPRTVTVTST
ncbi:hypothetical protein [Halosimplex sp. TS25]|uniref:hypothetical protein n=1 Tax=Halosimplex rarum TaxID=3396619 RepID=UPI0039EB21EF